MSQAKTGILLANLGTPEAPTPAAVKRYLRQFLSDTRVVDFPRLLWWPLLRGVILPIRSPRVAKLYQSVWMEEEKSLGLKVDLINEYDLAGAACWKLGFEDRSIWEIVSQVK